MVRSVSTGWLVVLPVRLSSPLVLISGVGTRGGVVATTGAVSRMDRDRKREAVCHVPHEFGDMRDLLWCELVRIHRFDAGGGSFLLDEPEEGEDFGDDGREPC